MNVPNDKDLQVLKILVENEISVFKTVDFLLLSREKYGKVKYALSILTATGHINRIQSGLYCVRNFQNPFVVANAMQSNSIISYWSALCLHNLTIHIPNVVYSQSPVQKRDKTVFNIHFKFIKVKLEKMFGEMQMGYANEAFSVTDVEKTLLDCFDLPQYSGGYAELIHAFSSAKINSPRLLDYGLRMNNLSVLKRMAFLSELFKMRGFTRFQQEVLKRMDQKYTLIDPFGENAGEFNAKWRVRLNISKENLLNIIQNIY
jgi:predicted transcriptional regulator of viral defense system